VQLGVYIHVPFCLRRCGYCDFASSATAASEIPHRAYAAAVVRELELRAGDHPGLELASIYLGGGTPSLLAVGAIGEMLDAIRGRLAASPALEITIEANPGTVDERRLSALRALGVNRLSLGVQSLDDRSLALLGRIHDAAAARAAIRAARAAGFTRLSCDVIFGLPGQTLAHHLAQLRALCELAPDHVSAYGLSLSPGSALSRAGLQPAADELQAEMMEAGRALLEEAGLPQYEVSSFAPESERSRHNLLCWSGRPYLGLGASAHSMVQDGAETLRIANPPLSRYLEAAPSPGAVPARLEGAVLERVGEASSRFELLFLGLRTVDGVDREHYAARFGADPLAHFGPALRELEAQGLLSLANGRLAPTRRGIWFADELALRLLACQNCGWDRTERTGT
jgi:oxygen-independent coproporphyrinogen-3 oxidase